jgi:hypothetical protein
MKTFEHGGWIPVSAAIACIAGIAGCLQLARANFALGGLLCAVSVLALRWPRSLWSAPPLPPLSATWRRLGIAAVLATGVFFRFYRITPPGLWGDDAINGLLAFDILDGRITSPFQIVSHSYSYFHALSNYPIAAAFRLFGAGPTVLRLPGIVAGTLAVPLLYATAAPLFGVRVALAAALFFAASPLQIGHAKGLIQVVLGEFFQLLGLCLLVRGVTGRRRWPMAMAAVPLVGCIYTYHAAKLAPLVAIPYVLAALRGERGERRRQLVVYGAGLAALFALCLVPAVVTYAAHPGALTGRIEGTSILGTIREWHSLAPLWSSLWRTVMIFHYQQGPRYNWFGLGFDPGLDAVTAFLVLHGLLASLLRWRQPRNVLLLSWLACGLVPGFLSADAPRAYRVLLATPPVYVWAALPVVQILRAAAAPGRFQRWTRAVAVALVVAVPFVDFNYYFYRVYTHPRFNFFQAERMVEMARRLRRRGPGWTGYLLADSFGSHYETLLFLSRAWGLKIEDVASLADVLPLRDKPRKGALFMVTGTDLGAAPAIEAMYPGRKLSVRMDPKPVDWFLGDRLPLSTPTHREPMAGFIAVPREVLDRAEGVAAIFRSSDGRVIARRTQHRIGIDGAASLPSTPEHPARARWSAALDVPVDGRYRLRLLTNLRARLWIDGVPASPDEQDGRVPLPLARGLHRLSVVAPLSTDPRLRLLWAPPAPPRGGIAFVPVPPGSLYRRPGNGLLGEYDLGHRVVHRVEPYPYYNFFVPAFPGVYSARWRGRLLIPPPGSYEILPETYSEHTMTIDGLPGAGRKLDAGWHDFELFVPAVREKPRLQIHWRRAGGQGEAVPYGAWRPPRRAAASDRPAGGG